MSPFGAAARSKGIAALGMVGAKLIGGDKAMRRMQGDTQAQPAMMPDYAAPVPDVQNQSLGRRMRRGGRRIGAPTAADGAARALLG